MEAELIKNIRRFLGLNQEKFGRLIDVSKRTVAYYESGDKDPHPGTKNKLKELYTLIYEENMPKDEILHLLRGSSAFTKQTMVLNENPESYGGPQISKQRGTPYYDIDFVGGFDLVFNEQSITPAFYIDFPPYNDADAWINVTGKSMSPFISHGDIAAIKRIQNWKEFLPFGEIYAVITTEHRTIKILTEGKDDDHFTLVPYNKSREFVEQQIPKKMINNIYRVKGTIKKFF